MENCHAMVLVTMVRQFFIGTFCVYRPKREISRSGSFSCTILKESKYLQKHNIMVRRLTENGI